MFSGALATPLNRFCENKLSSKNLKTVSFYQASNYKKCACSSLSYMLNVCNLLPVYKKSIIHYIVLIMVKIGNFR